MASPLELAVTVNETALLDNPSPAATKTLPVVAPYGITAVMLLSLQLEMVAAIPPKRTLPFPCDVPNPVPLITTESPTDPEVLFTPEMAGTTVPLGPRISQRAR